MMTYQFDNEYIKLKSLIAEMTSRTSEMLKFSIKSLVERDSELARQVIEMDDEVDNLDIKIDDHCMKMIARLEPKAIDLRHILTAGKVMMDLERIGDYCVDISKLVLVLNDLPQVKPYVDMPKMAEHTAEMINDAISAYFNKNLNEALSVIKKDDVVDNYKDQIIRELFTYLAEDMKKSHAIISLIQITTSIERIADHATNVAELVYYLVNGNIIRHKSLKDIENEQNSSD